MPFYEKLRGALACIGGSLLTTSYLFCPLPFASYHVTVLDGVNVDNISNTTPIYRHELQTCIANIESALLNMPKCTVFLETAFSKQALQKMSFQFEGLEIWGHQVLVALLTPTTDSRSAFNTLDTRREKPAKQLLTELQVTSFSPYAPHISLGYFANKEAGLRVRAHLSEWSSKFENTVGNDMVSFDSVSLYGFTDMASFFRARRAP